KVRTIEIYTILHTKSVDNSCSSDGANLYGARATGAAPGTKSIWNSTCRVGGNPGKSSGKTSGKSRTVAHPQVSSPPTCL
ncbi:hypothetical protein Tco_0447701, partial [Tanacetum coccineum]